MYTITTLDANADIRHHPLIASAHAAGENRNIFETFVRGFISELQPVGAIEITLAARAAGIAWRLNRAQGLETQILTKPKGYSSSENALEDALSNGGTREAVEMVARWEQGLERSLLKTLEYIDKAQRTRSRRKLIQNEGEPKHEKTTGDTNTCENGPKEIEFGTEVSISRVQPGNSPKR